MVSSSYVPLTSIVEHPSPDRLKSEDGTYEDSSERRAIVSEVLPVSIVLVGMVNDTTFYVSWRVTVHAETPSCGTPRSSASSASLLERKNLLDEAFQDSYMVRSIS